MDSTQKQLSQKTTVRGGEKLQCDGYKYGYGYNDDLINKHSSRDTDTVMSIVKICKGRITIFQAWQLGGVQERVPVFLHCQGNFKMPTSAILCASSVK